MSAPASDAVTRLARLVALGLLDPEDALTAAMSAEARATGLAARTARALDQAIDAWGVRREQAEAEIRGAVRPRLKGATDLAGLFPIAWGINGRLGLPLVTREIDALIADELQTAIAEGRRRGL